MPFSAIEKSAPKTPGRTLVLQPSVFADEWKRKPKAPVCVGLRLMSEADRSRSRAEAERIADDHHPRGGANWVDCFNDALVRQAAALGICDPNDATKQQDTRALPHEGG